MFENTLNASWDERSRRGFTALTSFGLQALAVAVLLIIPLLRPAGLPLFHTISTPVSLGKPPGERPSTIRRTSVTSSPLPHNNALDLTLRTPTRISNGISVTDDDNPPQLGPIGIGPTGDTIGDAHGISNVLRGGKQPVLPVAPPPERIAPVRISHISEGDLIHKVLPTYPSLARGARIQGQVILQAVISKQGTIENLRLLTGHPMLVAAAIEAVRQWRYRPYVLNGQPVEVETQITVNFSLSGN